MELMISFKNNKYIVQDKMFDELCNAGIEFFATLYFQ